MKPIVAVIAFSFVAAMLSLCSDRYTTNMEETSRPARKLNVDTYPNLMAAAEKIANATERKDAIAIVDLTYPKYVDMFGGREAVVDKIANGFREFNENGAQIISLEAEKPKEVFEIDNELFALVPLTVSVRTSNGSSKGTDAMIAVSNDDGITWSFITGMGQTDLEKVLPKVAEKIKIPESADL
jgi:hypothetical protein